MDYYNSMLPQNQPPMMPSMHYSQMVQPEIGQDLWDHDKHVSHLVKTTAFVIEINKQTKIMKKKIMFCYILESTRMVKMD